MTENKYVPFLKSQENVLTPIILGVNMTKYGKGKIKVTKTCILSIKIY